MRVLRFFAPVERQQKKGQMNSQNFSAELEPTQKKGLTLLKTGAGDTGCLLEREANFDNVKTRLHQIYRKL